MKTVTVYTHEKSDTTHSVQDKVAIVLGEVEHNGVKVIRAKVFEWGLPPYDAEVSPFPDSAPVDANGNIVYGGTYYRDDGSEAPDFEGLYKAKQTELYDAEYKAVQARWAKEREGVEDPKALAALDAKQLREAQLLAHKYEHEPQVPEHAPPEAKPDPKGPSAGKPLFGNGPHAEARP